MRGNCGGDLDYVTKLKMVKLCTRWTSLSVKILEKSTNLYFSYPTFLCINSECESIADGLEIDVSNNIMIM
jgi:hypothetical protein